MVSGWVRWVLGGWCALHVPDTFERVDVDGAESAWIAGPSGAEPDVLVCRIVDAAADAVVAKGGAVGGVLRRIGWACVRGGGEEGRVGRGRGWGRRGLAMEGLVVVGRASPARAGW